MHPLLGFGPPPPRTQIADQDAIGATRARSTITQVYLGGVQQAHRHSPSLWLSLQLSEPLLRCLARLGILPLVQKLHSLPEVDARARVVSTRIDHSICTPTYTQLFALVTIAQISLSQVVAVMLS